MRVHPSGKGCCRTTDSATSSVLFLWTQRASSVLHDLTTARVLSAWQLWKTATLATHHGRVFEDVYQRVLPVHTSHCLYCLARRYWSNFKT